MLKNGFPYARVVPDFPRNESQPPLPAVALLETEGWA